MGYFLGIWGMTKTKTLHTVFSLLVLIFVLPGVAFAKSQCFGDPKQAYRYLLKQEALVKKPLINLNTASTGELATLDGVGVKTAQNIVLYRQTMGRFDKIEDIMQIKGIGEKTFAKNRHRLTVDE